MKVSESERHGLYEWARRSMGEQTADTFMSVLPPTGWEELATRRDIDLLRAELRGDLRGELGDLRGELGDLRGELGDLRGELRELGGDLRAEMADRFRRQTTLLVSAISGLGGLVLAVGGVTIAAVRYL